MDCLGTPGSGALFAPVTWALADKKLKGTAVMRPLQGLECVWSVPLVPLRLRPERSSR
jgi:hypothetical protein